jgi:hypothetical protein
MKDETEFFKTEPFLSLWNELFESKKLVREIRAAEKESVAPDAEDGRVEDPVKTLKDFMYTILVNTDRITHDNGWIGNGKDMFRFLGAQLKTFRIIGCKGNRYRDGREPFSFVKIPDKKVLRFFDNCSQLFNPLDSDGYCSRLMPYYRSFAMNKIAIYYDCVIRYGLKPVVA